MATKKKDVAAKRFSLHKNDVQSFNVGDSRRVENFIHPSIHIHQIQNR